MNALADTSLNRAADAAAGRIQMTEMAGMAESCADSSSRSTEQAMQEIAGLATLICDMPLAALALRGVDVTWYRSGARIEGGACPKHNPFNAYAMQCADLFEVPDTSQGERLAATSTLVDGLTVCSYAGASLRAADGSVFGTLAVLDAVPRRLTAKQRTALLSLARHATTELALCEELTVARARVESAPVAIYQTDARGQIIYANPEYRRFLGLGHAEPLENWANGVHADDRPRMEAAWADFCRDPQPVTFEWRSKPRDGASRVLTEHVVAAAGTSGFIGTITDITERAVARANLQRADTLSHQTFEQAPIGIIYADRDGRVLRGNHAFCNLLGFNPREIETTSIAQFTYEADVANNALEFERLWSGEIDVIDVEKRYVRTDRRTVWVRVTTALVRDANGVPTCAVEFLRDISARKDLAVALLQNQRLLEAVIADLPVAIRACDVAGRVFLHNPEAAALFAMGKVDHSSSEAHSPDPLAIEFFLSDGKTRVPSEERPLARALRGDTVTNMEFVIARPGDAVRATRTSARRLTGANGECLGAVAVTQDITQKKELERELAQAQKLESIGQLAAGIAHEINTPTQFIGDNIRFLHESFRDVLGCIREIKAAIAAATGGTVIVAPIAAALDAPDMTYLQDEIPKAIAQSLEGVARIAKIVGAMKEFSHPGVERTPLDLNRAITSTITVASNEWKYVADVKTEFDSSLPLVPVMPGAFNQVILNMIVNAAHAISAAAPPEATSAKGTITVTTRQVCDSVEIRIADTGCGIPANIIPRIFDPFFTTKPVGKGTGQGLAIAHDVVVTKHGGTIAVESEPGVGTTFTLRLPLKTATAASAETA
jgi:PAS domain S-box-containing protein